LNLIVKRRPGKREFLAAVKRLIRREMRRYANQPTATSMDLTMDNIGSFTWYTALGEMQQLPTLYACLVGALTSRATEGDINM
jgi:hypothetical protein